MAILTNLGLQVAAVLVLVMVVVRKLIIQHLSAGNSKAKVLPPGPKGWPILGALPLLGSLPHIALANMAKKYGPVMYLKVGSCGMAVASSPETAKAFLKTLDMNFSNRPSNPGAIHLAYNRQDMAFADYGPRWKLLRKLSKLHMLGGKALEDWADVRKAEVGHMVKGMLESVKGGGTVVVSEMITYALSNMLGQVVLSRRVFDSQGSESNEFKDMVVEVMTLSGLFNIGDFIPSIAWMDLQGIEGRMKRLHKRFDVVLTRMFQEHEATAHERKAKPDFLDFVTASNPNPSVDNDNNNSQGVCLNTDNFKALLLDLFIAGTDTSSSIIEWALTELIKNPTILRRAQQEIDDLIGVNKRLVEEADIPKLPYLQAICKETFRKHPSVPINLPRIASEACHVNGYYIPKGTRLHVNIWAIGRDPNVWENPDDFNPDRFMVDLGGKHAIAKVDPAGGNDFELIPFGAGRRICAGARLGMLLVQYILATLVHSFDWELESESESESSSVHQLNMEETFGLALQKAVPLKAFVTPRLSLHAYAPYYYN